MPLKGTVQAGLPVTATFYAEFSNNGTSVLRIGTVGTSPNHAQASAAPGGVGTASTDPNDGHLQVRVFVDVLDAFGTGRLVVQQDGAVLNDEPTSCATAIAALVQSASAVTQVHEACGVAIQNAAELSAPLEALALATAQARFDADAAYFGLDLRYDSGMLGLADEALAGVDGRTMFIGLAGGHRIGSDPSRYTEFRARVGYRTLHIDSFTPSEESSDEGEDNQDDESTGESAATKQEQDPETESVAFERDQWVFDAAAGIQYIRADGLRELSFGAALELFAAESGDLPSGARFVGSIGVPLNDSIGMAVELLAPIDQDQDTSPRVQVVLDWAALLGNTEVAVR